MPLKTVNGQTLIRSGEPALLREWLMSEVGWPPDLRISDRAWFAVVIDLTDEDVAQSLVVEVLDPGLEILERVIL